MVITHRDSQQSLQRSPDLFAFIDSIELSIAISTSEVKLLTDILFPFCISYKSPIWSGLQLDISACGLLLRAIGMSLMSSREDLEEAANRV